MPKDIKKGDIIEFDCTSWYVIDVRGENVDLLECTDNGITVTKKEIMDDDNTNVVH